MLLLTPPQLAELEALGPYIVRLRLQVATVRDRNAQMAGFRSGLITGERSRTGSVKKTERTPSGSGQRLNRPGSLWPVSLA